MTVLVDNRQIFRLLDLASRKKYAAVAFTCWAVFRHLGAHAFYLDRKKHGWFYLQMWSAVLLCFVVGLIYQLTTNADKPAVEVLLSYLSFKPGIDPFYWVSVALGFMIWLRFLFDGAFMLVTVRRVNEQVDMAMRSLLGLLPPTSTDDQEAYKKAFVPPDDAAELISKLYVQEPLNSERN